MQNDLFVIRLEKQLGELRLKPSATVWQQVESRIQKEKKRRMILWWFFSSMIVLGAGGILMMQKNEESSSSANQNSEPKSEISINILKNIDNNEAPISAPTAIPLSKVITNTKNQTPSITNEKNTLLHSPQESSEIFSPSHVLHDRLKTSSKKTGPDAYNFITQNIKERTKDTIIVVNCNDNSITQSSAKNETKTKERQLNFNASYSFHGSGDLSGTNLEFGMEKRWGKRYGFFNNLGVTIHTGQEVGFTTNNNPLLINSTYNSLQTVTTGIQTAPTFYRYSKRGDLKIGAGLVARYQMSSYGNYVASSLGQGINQYSYTIYENDPNTLSIGYRISADLLLLEKKKNKLSFQLYFQNDTRGDVITGMGISFQTTYKK